MTKRYLIDANVFIQGKNFHYSFIFCKGFWEWVQEAHQQGIVYSIQKVKAELLEGRKDDDARVWAEKMPSDFFLDDVKDPKVIAAYKEIMGWMSLDQHYSSLAKSVFSDSKRADAFLLAYAKAYGYTVVTQEISDPNKKKSISIPDAATRIGNIKTIPIYELLSRHAKQTFAYKS